MPYKLLLADDSITVQRVIELTFSREDVEVTSVSDGDAAIARMAVDRPDIVLADVGMSHGSGYDVAAHVKGRPDMQHVPVLLLAGAFEPLDTERADRVGFDGVLVKPFEPQHVIARVLELLHQAQERAAESSEEPAIPALLADPSSAIAQEPLRDSWPSFGDDEAAADDARPREDEAFSIGDWRTAPAGAPGVPGPDPPLTTTGEDRTGEPGREALDAYFERLDAAFDHRTSSSAPPVDVDPSLLEPEREVVEPERELLEPDRELVELGPEPASLEAVFQAVGNEPAPPPGTPREPGPPPVMAAPPSADVAAMLAVALDTAPPVREIRDLPELHARVELPERLAARAPDLHAGSAPHANGRQVLADAFTALLAFEQGEEGAALPSFGAAVWTPVITSAFVDEVTRRVVERLAPDAAKGVVVRVVSEIAERVVREEVGRARERGLH